MRKLLNLLGMALIAVMVFFPIKSNAAGKNVCETLKASKTYHYNLDQKGKKESIRVNVSKKQHKKSSVSTYDLKTTVTVNGKQIYSKLLKDQHSDNHRVKVMVTDTDKKDKQMELLIIEGDVYDNSEGGYWAADMEHIYYYKYADGTTKRRQDLAPLFRKNFADVFMLHGMNDDSYLTVNGKNEICARLCLKVKNFDYPHVKVELKLKNGKFVKDSAKLYNLLDTEDFFFRIKKNISVYTKPGGRKKAFTVKKKETLYPCGVYTKNGRKLYIKVKNKEGKAGYIDPSKVSTVLDGTNHVM